MEPLTRIDYRDPATHDPRLTQTTMPDSLVDYEKYLRPWTRAHLSALHARGVASGLEVRATPGATGVRVRPGVAVTATGDHVVLAATPGRAVVGGTRVPVPETGVTVPTTGLNGDHVLRVSPKETFEVRVIEGGERQVQDHTPELTLRPAGGAPTGPDEVVLARVTLAGGTVTALDVGERVPSAGTTRVPRSQVGPSGSDLAVTDDAAATLRHVAGSGLTLTAGGRFTVEAEAFALTGPSGTMTLAPGRLGFAGSVEVANGLAVKGGALDAQQGLRVTGGTVTAAAIGPTDTTAGLRLTGPLTLDGAVTVTGGALTLNDVTPTAGQLTVSKGLRVTGGSLDAQQGAQVTGALSVSGDLKAERVAPAGAQLEVTKGLRVGGGVVEAQKGLTVTGALTVNGGALTVNEITSTAAQVTVSKGVAVTGGLLDAQKGLRVVGDLAVDKITPAGAQLEVAKGLRVGGGVVEAQKGLTVTGALTVNGGALTVNEITPTAAQVTVSKGVAVTGGLLDAQKGLRVVGDLAVDQITPAGTQLEVTKGFKVSGGNLTVDQDVKARTVEVNAELRTTSSGGNIFTMSSRTDGRWRLSGVTGAGAVDRIVVAADGKVGIGPAAPNFALDVQGVVCAQSYCNPSDARLKSDVAPLHDVLGRLATVRGVRFRSTLDGDDRTRVGVVAQEVETGFPELVVSAGPDDMKAVDYGGFVGVLVAAVHELDARNADLARRLAVLEDEAAEGDG
ncbi:tail fiber domain-containing protein [Pseudonocardia charpentierae]|uniref:Tail fiber domain-containing protein n=1 Tax=Pseudonocardia charpentierae TaxID=3075545 RepID=A0ABU2NKK9_9PSEU|nr:tail fiber domain-containing protein [Pseudonocardia sp. DSM 45834]MDT0353139.1 tail fiber domain-containing protein [Pseudonocardia sp. DSM 45834]